MTTAEGTPMIEIDAAGYWFDAFLEQAADSQRLERELAAAKLSRVSALDLRDLANDQCAAAEKRAESAEARLAEANRLLSVYAVHETVQREAALLEQLAAAQEDAERYRWLREHFMFANDSMQEIWFDASIKVPTLPPPHPEGIRGESIAPELDSAIDAARAEKKEPSK